MVDLTLLIAVITIETVSRNARLTRNSIRVYLVAVAVVLVELVVIEYFQLLVGNAHEVVFVIVRYCILLTHVAFVDN